MGCGGGVEKNKFYLVCLLDKDIFGYMNFFIYKDEKYGLSGSGEFGGFDRNNREFKMILESRWLESIRVFVWIKLLR